MKLTCELLEHTAQMKPLGFECERRQATERKINSIKHTLEKRKSDALLAEQRKNDLIVYVFPLFFIMIFTMSASVCA